jgi:hypothetical protein
VERRKLLDVLVSGNIAIIQRIFKGSQFSMLNKTDRDDNLIDILNELIFKVLFRNREYGRTIIKREKEQGREESNVIFPSFHK